MCDVVAIIVCLVIRFVCCIVAYLLVGYAIIFPVKERHIDNCHRSAESKSSTALKETYMLTSLYILTWPSTSLTSLSPSVGIPLKLEGMIL